VVLLAACEMLVHAGPQDIYLVVRQQIGIDQREMVERPACAGDRATLGKLVDVDGLVGCGQVRNQHAEPSVARLRVGGEPERTHQATFSLNPRSCQCRSSQPITSGIFVKSSARVRRKIPAALAMSAAAWK